MDKVRERMAASLLMAAEDGQLEGMLSAAETRASNTEPRPTVSVQVKAYRTYINLLVRVSRV